MDNDEAEQRVTAACERGDYDEAASVAIEHFGGEILGFLVARMGNHDDASEVFAQFSENFWQSLSKFQGKCSVRTWAYKIARFTASKYRRSARRQQNYQVQVTNMSRLSQAVAHVRTATLNHLKTETKSRFQMLREQLAPEDQTLLILRVDRGMSWRELAVVVMEEGDHSDEMVTKEAARLRKRFQAAKEKLRELAQAEGLLGD